MYKTILTSAMAFGSSQDNFVKFETWKQDFGKVYKSSEENEMRFKIFQEFLAIVDQRNIENEQAGGSPNAHGLTQFSDLTQEEFRNTYLMKEGFYKPRVHTAETTVENKIDYSGASIFDWRDTPNVVTPVKNQAQCGSCWAFSATEAVESYGYLAGAMKNNQSIPLSTEQSCSCTYAYNGCNGGNPQNVYSAAIAAYNGEESAADYSYKMNCGTCEATSSTSNKYVNTNGYTNAPRNSLQTTLAGGPPSVCVAAEVWNSYTGGVLSSCPGSVDHCVQAVGYNTAASTPYFMVRNSWGSTWGEKGYIYLSMAGDTCQVQSDINYPKPIKV